MAKEQICMGEWEYNSTHSYLGNIMKQVFSLAFGNLIPEAKAPSTQTWREI